MPMVKGLDNALECVSGTHPDAGQAEDIAVASLCGGLQARADRTQGNTEGAGAGLAERPAEDAVADSVTVELQVVGPTAFGDIELELPEGFYNDNDGRAVYALNEEVLKSA